MTRGPTLSFKSQCARALWENEFHTNKELNNCSGCNNDMNGIFLRSSNGVLGRVELNNVGVEISGKCAGMVF